LEALWLPNQKHSLREKMHTSSELAVAPAERNMQSQALEGWYAENLRLTFFGAPNWTQHPIFSEIAGVVPAQINSQPATQQFGEVGDIAEAYLNVSQQANRIDVVLSDQPTRNTVDPALPGYKPLYWVGPFDESIKRFDGISARATTLVSGATRVAFAITLVHQTSSIHEALASLHKFVPTVKFDPDHDLDLSFQINRPTRDQKGRFINRLARWDTIQILSMRIAIGSGVPPVPSLASQPPRCAGRIYVDISTDAENTIPITGSELSDLVIELRGYAIDIAQKGDSQ
jgi:hypothetical protein